MMNCTFKVIGRLVSRRKEEAGSAIVELALSTPLFALVLLGAAEFARVTYAAIEVTNAARAGAQYAAMLGGATGDTGGIQNAAQADAVELGSTVTTSVAADTCVCSGAESTTVSCTSTCPTGQHIMETVTIQANATYYPLFSYKGIMPGVDMSGPFTLHGSAKQLVLPQ